jgi:hypothetical protein
LWIIAFLYNSTPHILRRVSKLFVKTFKVSSTNGLFMYFCYYNKWWYRIIIVDKTRYHNALCNAYCNYRNIIQHYIIRILQDIRKLTFCTFLDSPDYTLYYNPSLHDSKYHACNLMRSSPDIVYQTFQLDILLFFFCCCFFLSYIDEFTLVVFFMIIIKDF